MMNFLSTLHYNSFSEFSIKITEIKYSWMDMTLRAGAKQFDYTSSYFPDCHPLDDLLEKVVLLLTKEPVNIYENTHFTKENIIKTVPGKYELLLHELEPGFIEWIFRFSDEVLTILIFNDLGLQLLDDLMSYDFSVDQYEAQEYKKVPELTDNLLFALQGNPLVFAQHLINVFKELDEKNNDDKYTGAFDVSYSKDNFDKLAEWIKKQQGMEM